MLSALELAIIAILACLAWWGSTGLILLVLARPEKTHKRAMLVGVMFATAAIFVVWQTAMSTTVTAIVASFLATLAIWGAIEMAFLMGYVIGPVRETCPPDLTTWNRFKASWHALSHHELALAGALTLLFFATRGAPNTMAFDSFALLWLMRLSTKLNIFLGVRNASEELLGPRTRHLASYFRKATMNPLFPVSITATTLVTILLASEAVTSTNAASAAGATLLATFAALAVVEHCFLMLPLQQSALWPWPTKSETPTPARSVEITSRAMKT
jgi:putative photosynthetic complex assembly protein 2